MLKPLILLLLSTSALAQAVAPVRPPAPSIIVTTPPGGVPGATPAGAGLPRERVPAPAAPTVKRPQNWTRSGERPELRNPDDLYAAGESFEEVTPRILDVPLPLLDGAKGASAKATWLRWCSGEMGGFIAAAATRDSALTGLLIHLLTPEREAERACLAGELMKLCVRRSTAGIAAVAQFDLANYQIAVQEWARLRCIRKSEKPGGAPRSWLTDDVLTVRNAVMNAADRSKQ